MELVQVRVAANPHFPPTFQLKVGVLEALLLHLLQKPLWVIVETVLDFESTHSAEDLFIYQLEHKALFRGVVLSKEQLKYIDFKQEEELVFHQPVSQVLEELNESLGFVLEFEDNYGAEILIQVGVEGGQVFDEMGEEFSLAFRGRLLRR